MSSASALVCDPDPLARPDWACALHAPPRRVGAWIPADHGYAVCQPCDDQVRERLDDVGRRYLQLDPRPGGTGESGFRGSPGFASKPPLNLHVVALRDPRSSTDARIWVGCDGRVHGEDERPPRSVHGVLNTQAWGIAEHRGIDGPGDHDDVFALVRWLGRYVNYAARHAELIVELDAALRDLIGQLRPVTGDRRKPIGLCPAQLRSFIAPCRCGHEDAVHDNDSITGERRCHYPTCGCRAFIPIQNHETDQAETEVCGFALFAPTNGADSIHCGHCGAHWERGDWLQLGDLLAEAS